MKKIVNITTLYLCCILLSCIDLNYADLGNHYAWMDDATIVKFRGKMNGVFDTIIIPQVLNFDYDDKYIIAYQGCNGKGYYYSSSSLEYENNKDSLLLQIKKMKQMKFCYWIIDKETGKVMGPMRKSEFDQKCKALNVKARMWKINEARFIP